MSENSTIQIFILQANLTDDLEKFSEICMPKSKVTPAELDQFFGHGMNVDDATDAVKCHVMCIMEQNGHVKDGVLDVKHVLDYTANVEALKDHQEGIAVALSICKMFKGENNCDTTFKMLMCFNNSEVGKLTLANY